ncbi:hypothetical protein HYV50_05080 [Candidatus Pacearchaeota archaeon]|nr:hypothetical protein [Candidatus Pacearchaeota archaeon]
MRKKQEILDLDNRQEAEKAMRNYLELEAPHYFGVKLVSLELVKDVAIRLFEGQDAGRVLVYGAQLEKNTEAFGTLGGMLYPLDAPYSNVFLNADVKDADTAAGMHFYWEAINRYPKFFSDKKNLEQLAENLKIPPELR